MDEANTETENSTQLAGTFNTEPPQTDYFEVAKSQCSSGDLCKNFAENSKDIQSYDIAPRNESLLELKIEF